MRLTEWIEVLKDILVFGKVKKFTVWGGKKNPITYWIKLEFECLGFFYFSLLVIFQSSYWIRELKSYRNWWRKLGLTCSIRLRMESITGSCRKDIAGHRWEVSFSQSEQLHQCAVLYSHLCAVTVSCFSLRGQTWPTFPIHTHTHVTQPYWKAKISFRVYPLVMNAHVWFSQRHAFVFRWMNTYRKLNRGIMRHWHL